jgi:predicted enzyme related to lactoylglutathione lyase
MTEKTEYPPGSPAWVDLGTPDPAAAKTFYQSLFGWELQDMGPDAGGYMIATLRGKQVAGVGPQMGPPGAPPWWTTYVYIEDADTTAKSIEAAGGKVMMPPFDVMDAGRMAVFTDPEGAVCAIWQPNQHRGAQLVNEPGTLCWNELASRDVEGAKRFYGAVFGWVGDTQTMGDMTYTEWKLNGESIGGMREIGPMDPPDLPPNWLVYFATDDTDATVAKVSAGGGNVMVPPTDIPPGRFAVVTDPQGTIFALIKMNPVEQG